MGPQDRQHSARPAAVGLIALALGAAVMAVAVPALRKPEREGWIALPPQPMDATDPDIRQLLHKSKLMALPSEIEGEDNLAERCGEDEVENEAIPADQVSAPATARGWDASAPKPRPLPAQRYILVLGHGPLATRDTRRVQIDIDGDKAWLRVRNGDVAQGQLPSAPWKPQQPRYAERRLPLSALAPLREAWNVPELWTANQRSSVYCSLRHELREAYFEACVDGRYFARDRACDRNAQEPLRLLWQRVTELTPAPPSKR